MIAGGGNLASTWPLHVYERAAIAQIAERLGRPLVVTGQTFGPHLEGRDRELVGGILRSSAVVGVREEASQALAADLGVSATLGVDDASFLGRRGDADAGGANGQQAGVLVSLSLSLGGAPRQETVAGIARLVDAAADTVGGPVSFHAHFGSVAPQERRGDAVLHDEVRAAMRTESTVLPTGDPVDAARLARSAGLLITGRYHPAVFAAPAGVPVLGLVTDEYTSVKQRGALAHWGQSTVVPIADAGAAGVTGMTALWRDRQAILREASARYPGHWRSNQQWWDRIAGAFD